MVVKEEDLFCHNRLNGRSSPTFDIKEVLSGAIKMNPGNWQRGRFKRGK